MKIKRVNLITHCWKQCLDPNYEPMDPNGWEINDNRLVPVWYVGSDLPSDTEYKSHIDELSDDKIPGDDDEMTDSSCSEGESES